jgi:hypothetical protein
MLQRERIVTLIKFINYYSYTSDALLTIYEFMQIFKLFYLIPIPFPLIYKYKLVFNENIINVHCPYF